MANLSFKQLEELWIYAGGKRTVAPTAAAIALAESGGNPNSTNHNSDGSVDRGLWQINSTHGTLSTYDIAGNAKAAVQIANEAKSFEPWVTYKTGAYQKYLPHNPSEGLSAAQIGEGAIPQSGLAGILGGKIPGFSTESKGEESAEHKLEKLNPISWTEDLVKILNFIVSGAGWLRIIKVTGGSLLILVAFIELAKVGSGGDLTKPKIPIPY